MEIGYLGLGKMGLNMVRRLVERGYAVRAYDPDEAKRAEGVAAGARSYHTIREVTHVLPAPRILWIMVPHKAVDNVIDELAVSLESGDIVIDGGNSYYKDSIRRAETFKEKGIFYLDAGISGGPRGARAGACVMVGGDEQAYKTAERLFHDIASPEAYARVGSSGAGHFVKMVHNGIEYGMMQALAEGFAILKSSDFHLNLRATAELYNKKSVIESRLVGWLVDAYREFGDDLSGVSGSVEQTGEGAWTVSTAREQGVSIPVIEGAVTFRGESETKPSYIGQVLTALRNQFGGHSKS